MGWTSGSFGLKDWTARSTLSTSELFPQSSKVENKWAFPLPVRFQWLPQTQGQNLLVQYCPVIPQLTRRHLHLWSSAAQPPAQISACLTFSLLFLGLTTRTVPTEMSYHPAFTIQKWLWTEYLKLTQLILNRRVKSKQLCNETFLIFKEQISGVSGKTVIKPTRTKTLEKYCRKDFECTL